MKSNSYVLRKTGEIPVLEEIEVDELLTTGQVLVRILYSGLCATQLEEIFISKRNHRFMPHLFGHEAVAQVLEVDSRVTKVSKGDICVIHWKKSSEGLDADAGRYFFRGQKLNAGKVVTFGEISVVPENRLTKFESNLSLELAPLLGCAYPTGWGAVANSGRPKSEDQILIVGLGGVGLAILETALTFSTQSISTIDTKRQLPLSPSFADRVTHHTSFEDYASQIVNPTLVFDTSGDIRTLNKLLERISSVARIVLVGMPSGGENIALPMQKLLDGLQIIGSNGGDVDPFFDFVSYCKVLESADTFSMGMSIAVSAIDDLAKAIQDHQSGLFRRAVIKFS